MTAAISQTIREQFAAQWATLQPTVPYYFAGVPIDRQTIEGRAWVRLTILPGQTQQVGFNGSGGRRKRTQGVANVQIFVPSGAGDGLAQELADSVAEVWEMRTIEGVIFRATSVQRAGEDGAWLLYSATTPYQGDTLVP